jgi:hypothetical protein
MNMKTTRNLIINFLVTILILYSTSDYAFSVQTVTGEIYSAIILQERIHLAVGDKALTNLGSKDGIIKGDILVITSRHDMLKEKPIGQCAVTSVDVKTSICEIITANMEIARGSVVSLATMHYTMDKLFPAAYKVLSKSVDSFPAHEKVKISIYDFFDNNNNITKFSERIKQEMKDVFVQKKRVQLVEPKTVKKDFFLYPEDIKNSYGLRTEVMETLGVDVFITGSYSLNNDNAIITFYKFDKNFNDEKITFQMPLNSTEIASANEITAPFRSLPKKEYIACTVALKEHQYVPQKEEKRDIIGHEAGNDVFKIYDLRRTNFNIISPVDILFKVNDQSINFSGKSEAPVLLTKGTHKLSASFRRGYFFNTRDPKLYVSEKPVEKEVILTIDKDASLYVDVSLNPAFEGENIDFKIYDVSLKKTQLLKTIIKTESSKTIEIFKD